MDIIPYQLEVCREFLGLSDSDYLEITEEEFQRYWNDYMASVQKSIKAKISMYDCLHRYAKGDTTKEKQTVECNICICRTIEGSVFIMAGCHRETSMLGHVWMPGFVKYIYIFSGTADISVVLSACNTSIVELMLCNSYLLSIAGMRRVSESRVLTITTTDKVSEADIDTFVRSVASEKHMQLDHYYVNFFDNPLTEFGAQYLYMGLDNIFKEKLSPVVVCKVGTRCLLVSYYKKLIVAERYGEGLADGDKKYTSQYQQEFLLQEAPKGLEKLLDYSEGYL